MHTGVDIAWSFGTPVLATADGKVVQAGWSDDLGNHIVIQHKYGFSTRYSHLKGSTVKRGDTIGYLGSTGLSTGTASGLRGPSGGAVHQRDAVPLDQAGEYGPRAQ